MNRIVGLFVALLVLSAFFWLVESLFAANPRQLFGTYYMPRDRLPERFGL